MTLSNEVKNDIRGMIEILTIVTPSDVNGNLCDECQLGDSCEHDCTAMCLTVAVNEDGTEWNYQTGHNSYTGGCYGLPHWAVVWISHDDDRMDTYLSLLSQLGEALAS